jgi:Protein of unknown function (DUF2877)
MATRSALVGRGQTLASTPLAALRVSRCVREHTTAGGQGRVYAIQRRGCHLTLDRGELILLSRPDVPLAPNALTVDLAPDVALEDLGFRVGQVIALGARVSPDRAADWVVELETGSAWEPRPLVHPLGPRDLADRMRTTRATVIAEGARESLLPLLWTSSADAVGLHAGVVRVAEPSARLLGDAARRGDAVALARAARDLAGLGPGLTPSGDDLLAGFVAAWTLAGEALGHDRSAREQVTAAIATGAARGASPLGWCWLEHACRGELLEPMTRFVDDLLAPAPRDVGATARGALAVGASSGADWMVGFLLAVERMLDAPSSRPRW